jgi:putrescine aminotransferase
MPPARQSTRLAPALDGMPIPAYRRAIRDPTRAAICTTGQSQEMPMTSAAQIKRLWTHKTQDHPFLPDEELIIERGEGVWVWTERGRKLLDAFAGLAVVNVGHGRREIAEAVAEQTVRLAYYPTTRQFSNRPAAELAAKLAELTPGDLGYSMFAVSGSEANERAMQMARHYWLATGHPEKYKVLSLEGGYHGATGATLNLCGIPDLVKAYAPLQVPGFVKVKPPYPFRDRGAGTDEALVERRAGELREAILREGPDTVSAVIMEPVVSSGGFIMPPIGWLRAVRRICDELDVLMIADEVITGFGRTGRWFACEHDGVVPDLLSVAKGITSGYVPLSACIASRRLADAFPEDAIQENVHPNTYAAHPVACAAALANLQILQKDGLVDNAEAMGARLREGLRGAVGRSPIVGEVRGRGLMVCAEFVAPDGSGQPLDRDRVALLDRLGWERGAILYARGSVVRLAPPLCITPGEVDQLVAIVADSISTLEKICVA